MGAVSEVKKEGFRVDNIKTKGTGHSLNGLYLRGFSGEILGLVGLRSSGIDDLLKVLCGKLQVLSGKMYLQEKLVRKEETLKNKVFHIHKELSMMENLTVAENICMDSILWNKMRMINWRMINFRTRELLQSYECYIDPSAQIKNLDPVDKAIVTLIRAVEQKPEILIVDNVTATYSEQEFDRFAHRLDKIKQLGITILFVSSDIGQMMRICDRIAVLRNGRKAGVLSEDIFEEGIVKQLLLGDSGKTEEYKELKIQEEKRIAMQIQKLCYQDIFEAFQLRIHTGEIVGVINENSDHERLLVDIITGRVLPEYGELEIGGVVYDLSKRKRRFSQEIGIFNGKNIEGQVFDNLTVEENFMLPILDKCKMRGGTIDRSYGRFLFSEYKDALEISAEEWGSPAKDLNLNVKLNMILYKFLAQNCKVIILYEPFAYLDLLYQERIQKFMNVAAGKGVGILVCVSAKTKKMTELCHRVLDSTRGK